MLSAINTKILIAILAVLTAIGALVVHNNRVNEKAAADAARAAAILQQQQKAAEDAKKANEETAKHIKEIQKKHSSYDRDGSKTITTYMP